MCRLSGRDWLVKWLRARAVCLLVQICHVTTNYLIIGYLVGNISEANYEKTELLKRQGQYLQAFVWLWFYLIGALPHLASCQIPPYKQYFYKA